jgi:predicted ATPase
MREEGEGGKEGGKGESNCYVVESSEHSPLWGRFQKDLLMALGGGGLMEVDVSVQVMMGRTLVVPFGNKLAGICYFSFDALCKKEKGAADYAALCSNYHTLYLDGPVPVMGAHSHNEARRFITLVDELYNSNVQLIWSAQKHPLEIFQIMLKDFGLENEENIISEKSDSHLKTHSRGFEQRTFCL